MRVRGGGSHPLPPATLKSGQTEAQRPKKVLEQALDGVLKPGQHLVMPARTGLSQLADHFDARQKPDYDKLLKGETSPQASASKSPEDSPEARAAEQAATAFAAESAMAMLDLLPPMPVQTREAELDEVDDDPLPEREEPRDSEEDPPHEPRTLELQGGIFTLDEGSVDVASRRLCTLEAHLDGDVQFVSCAVDLHAIPEGTELRIPALEAAVGKPVRLRAVHQTSRTEGVGTAYLEVCVSDPEAWRAVLDAVLAVQLQ